MNSNTIELERLRKFALAKREGEEAYECELEEAALEEAARYNHRPVRGHREPQIREHD